MVFMNIKSVRKIALLRGAFIAFCLVTALFLVCTLPGVFENGGGDFSLSNAEYEEVVEKCDVADQKLVGEAVDDLNRYFDAMERGIDPFLDDIYGLTSKAKMIWYLVTDFDVEFEDGDVSPFLMALVMPIKSVSRGDSLPNFIECKFDSHFGSGLDVKNEMRRIVDTLIRELSFNNGRMAVELGEITQGSLGESTTIVSASSSKEVNFEDVAKKMSISLVSRTSGMQLVVELVFLAADVAIAEYIAAPLVTLLVNSGLIALNGMASGVVTWGAGIAVAISADIAANKISKTMLKPKLEKVLLERRRETLSTFQRELSQRLQEYHRTRRDLLKQKLRAV